MPNTRNGSDRSRFLTLRIDHEQLVVQRRYQAVSILNDLHIGVWFLVGSVFFFYPDLKEAGIWLFAAGSFRPVVLSSRPIHLRRLPEDSWDFQPGYRARAGAATGYVPCRRTGSAPEC